MPRPVKKIPTKRSPRATYSEDVRKSFNQTRKGKEVESVYIDEQCKKECIQTIANNYPGTSIDEIIIGATKLYHFIKGIPMPENQRTFQPAVVKDYPLEQPRAAVSVQHLDIPKPAATLTMFPDRQEDAAHDRPPSKFDAHTL